jgi:hypothetical protein
MANFDQVSRNWFGPFGRNLTGFAEVIEQLHEHTVRRNTIPSYQVVRKQLQGAFAKLEAVKPDGAKYCVRIRVEECQGQWQADEPRRRRMLDLAVLIDAIGDELAEMDYAIPDNDTRRRIVSAFERLNQTMLSRSGMSVSAKVVYPRHRQEPLVG